MSLRAGIQLKTNITEILNREKINTSRDSKNYIDDSKETILGKIAFLRKGFNDLGNMVCDLMKEKPKYSAISMKDPPIYDEHNNIIDQNVNYSYSQGRELSCGEYIISTVKETPLVNMEDLLKSTKEEQITFYFIHLLVAYDSAFKQLARIYKIEQIRNLKMANPSERPTLMKKILKADTFISHCNMPFPTQDTVKCGFEGNSYDVFKMVVGGDLVPKVEFYEFPNKKK